MGLFLVPIAFLCWRIDGFHIPPSCVRRRSFGGMMSHPFARASQRTDKLEGSPSPKYDEAFVAPKGFEEFDYLAHWYPVVWARDLVLHKPTKVTVFDVDYAIARLDDSNVIAMVDRCPHKAAAISEGRVTSSGYFQCAYHGWSFNGVDGACVEIPQVVSANGVMTPLSKRTCGKAVPAMIQNQMVWIFPAGNLEQALVAEPPPYIPEMDQQEFVSLLTIREMPIDWSIVVENILDPDHGMFAHCASGFDLYTASKDAPQEIEERFPKGGKGWQITSRVKAIEKLRNIDKRRRGQPTKETKEEDVKIGTSTFTAPNHLVIGRRNSEGITSFITAFWICPTGTGRSRFLAASILKGKFRVPRFIGHIAINNFLDQDTYLLATQQKHVLLKEVEAVEKQLAELTLNSVQGTDVRRETYAYNSPTEKIAIRVGALWDATLSRAPNRVPTLRKMNQAGQLDHVSPREVVLDREEQHLRICPDSQAFVDACTKIQNGAWFSGVALAVVRLFLTTLNPPVGISSKIASVCSPHTSAIGLLLAVTVGWAARKLKKEFFFKYSEKLRDRDLKKIPKMWMDKA